MKKFLLRVYSIYAVLLFAITFIIFFPIFFISAQKVKWHRIGLKSYSIWANIYFPLILFRFQIEKRYHPDQSKQYIICANHFSYFDIPTLVKIPLSFKYIGKSSISSMPLFGYMFRKIHIQVNRASLRSKAESIKKASEALDQGFNIAFFPEGGIKSNNPPEMVRFQDGAFRLAVEKQLPILPITIPNNYKIMPDDGKFLLHWHRIHLIIHEPVYPSGSSDSEIPELRKQVFDIIQRELNLQEQIA